MCLTHEKPATQVYSGLTIAHTQRTHTGGCVPIRGSKPSSSDSKLQSSSVQWLPSPTGRISSSPRLGLLPHSHASPLPPYLILSPRHHPTPTLGLGSRITFSESLDPTALPGPSSAHLCGICPHVTCWPTGALTPGELRLALITAVAAATAGSRSVGTQ